MTSTKATSTSASSSSPFSQLSSATWGVDTLDVDEVLEILTNAKAQVSYWQDRVQACLDRLDSLVETGETDPDLTWNDWHIYRQPGKRSFDYPDYIKEKEEDLRQAKEMAIVDGDATLKQGKPFWTVKRDPAV